VLIRGFNNSYDSFHAKYAQMRQWLGVQGAAADVRYVEVYWDPLHRAGGRVAYPVALFTRSRGNAERAGACGLRDLLRRLPPGTDVTLLAHSLGAVVAMAAMADVPPGREAPTCDGKPAPDPVPAQLGDVRIAAFAPAVGAGLLEDDKGQVPPALLSHIARFYVAFNPNDPAVTKRKLGLNLPDTLGGDTRLGGNSDFVAQVDDRLAAAGLADGFQTLRFEHKAHELPTYLADTARAQCLLWAAKVLPDAPHDCGLTR
jgi:pimeloyl-ACP methyl ester carboxylesterase